MKKLTIILSIFIYTLINAQVDLGLKYTEHDKNLLFDMRQTQEKLDKPFILPNVDLKDVKKKDIVDLSSSNNIEEGLMIYNNGFSNDNPVGPYYWSEKNQAWSPIVTTTYLDKLKNLSNMTIQSIARKSDVNIHNNISYIGENINDTWVFPSTGSTIQFNLFQSKSFINVITGGFYEIHIPNIKKQLSRINRIVSFDIGLFVDGKLQAVQTVTSEYVNPDSYNEADIKTGKIPTKKYHRQCGHNYYNKVFYISNLQKGRHTVRIGYKTRMIFGLKSNEAKIVYNGRASECIKDPYNKFPANRNILTDSYVAFLVQESPEIQETKSDNQINNQVNNILRPINNQVNNVIRPSNNKTNYSSLYSLMSKNKKKGNSTNSGTKPANKTTYTTLHSLISKNKKTRP